MRKLFALFGVLVVFVPALSSAAIACPNLTDDMWYRSCDEALDEGLCLRHVPGDQVTRLQQFLTDYYNPPSSIILGYFGPRTKSYVQRFQQENGIPATGQVRNLTRAKIAQLCTNSNVSNSSNSNAIVTTTNTTQTTQSTQVNGTSQIITAPVTCSINVSPSSIAANQAATISWSSTNASAGYISHLGYIAVNGAQSMTFQDSAVVTGVFWNATTNQGAQCQSSVTVTPSATSTTTNSGTTTNTNVSTNIPCAFNGQTIAHGSVVTAYLSASVSAGGTCTPEIRTCTQGSLSGSYVNPSCTVLANNVTTTNTNTATYTYSWQSGAWNSCTSGTQTRTVTCMRNDNVAAGDAMCASAKPATAQSCVVAAMPAISVTKSGLDQWGQVRVTVSATFTGDQAETQQSYSATANPVFLLNDYEVDFGAASQPMYSTIRQFYKQCSGGWLVTASGPVFASPITCTPTYNAVASFKSTVGNSNLLFGAYTLRVYRKSTNETLFSQTYTAP